MNSYPRYHSNCGSRRPFRLSMKPFCPYAAGSGRFYLLSLSSFRLRSDSDRTRPAARTFRRVSVSRDPDTLSFKAFTASLPFSPALVNPRLVPFLFCVKRDGSLCHILCHRGQISPVRRFQFLRSHRKNGSSGSPFSPNRFTRSDQSVQAYRAVTGFFTFGDRIRSIPSSASPSAG